MSDRTLTFGGALLAIVIVFGLLGPSPVSEESSRPTSVDGGPHGFAAARRWIEHAAQPVAALKYRYSALAELAPGRGHVLITRLPHATAVRNTERDELVDWIAEGNALVMLCDGFDDNLEALADALALDVVLVTHNLRHFQKVQGLRLEDWY